MELRHLELLREFAARGSVTEVAKATYRTPSAVSQQLKHAQRELGAVLVEPSGRGLELTEAGLLLAESGEEVVIAMERAQARWDEFRGEPSGRVTVAALPSAAAFLLPEMLRRLAGGNIELVCHDIDTLERQFPKRAINFDIVIGHSMSGPHPSGTEKLTVVPLIREPLDVAMAAGHRLADKSALTPEDVAREAWIGVPEGYPFDTVLKSIAHAAGTDVRVVQRLVDNRLVEALVADSDRLAILPSFTTPRNPGLELRRVEGIDSSRDIMAMCRPDRAQRLAVRFVLDVMTDVAAGVAKRHDVG